MADDGLERLLQTRMLRRDVFGLGAFLAGLSLPNWAFGAGESHSILYGGWSDDIEELDAYKDSIKRMVGPEAAKDVHLVERKTRGDNRERLFGVVYVRDKDKATADRAATNHQKDFMDSQELGKTEVVANSEFEFLYNVRYGFGPKFDEIKKIYDTVYYALGARLGKHLAIEETDKGNYVVIYKRRRDKQTTIGVANTHRSQISYSLGLRKLERQGKHLSKEEKIKQRPEIEKLGFEEMKRQWMGVASHPERGFDMVYDESTYLHEKGRIAPYEEPRPQSKAATRPAEPKVALPKPESQKPQRTPEPKYENAPEPKREHQTTTSNGLTDKIRGMISQVKGPGLKIHGKHVKLPSEANIAFLVYDRKAQKDIVSINADVKMQSASAIKMFVYLGFLLANGKNKIDETTKNALKYMMWKSDNVATNYIMQKAGGPKRVQELIAAYDGGMAKGLSITDYIPLTAKDKLKAKARHISTNVPNGESFYSNEATARSYARFLDMLIDAKLPQSNLIREHMSLPGSDMIYTGVPEIPPGTEVIDKTGTTARVKVNPGAIGARNEHGEKHWYIIVPIVETKTRQNYLPFARAASVFMRGLSGVTYADYMKPTYKLK